MLADKVWPAFQFIPKVLNGVTLFHDKLLKPFLYGPGFVQRGTIMLNQKKKELPQPAAINLEEHFKYIMMCCMSS